MIQTNGKVSPRAIPHAMASWDLWTAYRAQLRCPITPSRSKRRSSPTSPVLEPSEIQEDTLDEGTQNVTSPSHNSSSSSDEAIMPPPPTIANDFKQFQELFKWVALSQEILLEEVEENQHQLLQILHASTNMKIALSINDALMQPADVM